jgi:hypothetical protein
MKRAVVRSQLSFGMFVGLALLVGNNVVGCGDSSSDSPDSTVAGNSPGGVGSPSGTTSSNGGGSATSGRVNTEGNPNNIQLDPNRDQSQPINLVASGAVQCGGGGSYCVAPNQTCCTVGGGMGMGNSFSCAANAAACPMGTTGSVSCSSKASCGSAQVCCRTGGGGNGNGGGGAATTSCEASCAMGSVQVCLDDAECGAGNQCNNNGTCGPIPCTATSCSPGQLCCRGGGGGGAQPTCVAPAAGLCPNNQRQVCAADTDCLAGYTCAPLGGGGNGGGGLVCTPPPCTTTSCTDGQLCCVGGQVGGNPTCSTANAGACPNNSRLLCVTDADCVSAAGTFCLAAPNGGNGQLSCRLPPPPASDAGVGDAG